MKSCGRTLLVLGACTLTLPAFALPEDNKYRTIIDRNAFGLKDPPPPPVIDTQAKEPPPNIEFTGVTVIGNEKRAWFAVLPKTPAEPILYVSLKAGEGSGPIELKEIFDAKGEARIVSMGRESTLSMKKLGGPSVGKPGMPGVPQLGIPQPVAVQMGGIPVPASSSVVAGAQNSVIATPSPSVIAGSSANRSMVPGAVTPTLSSTPAAVPNAAMTPQASVPSLRSIPTRTLRLQPANTQATTQSGSETYQPKSKDEAAATHALMIEATREAVAQKKMPPLPPLPQ